MENIKDFILDEVKDTEVTPKAKKPVNTFYDVVSVSGPDFIIRKRTSRASKVLVVIASKKQFYIKTENTGAIEKLTPTNYKSFFDGLTKTSPVHIIDENGNSPYWIDELYNSEKFRTGFFSVLNTLPKNNDYFAFITGNYLKYDCNKLCRMETVHTGLIEGIGLKRMKVVRDECVKYVSESAIKSAITEYVKYIYSYGSYYDPNNPDGEKVYKLLNNLFKENSTYLMAYDVIESKWGIEGVRQMIDMYMMCPVDSFPSVYELLNLFEHKVEADRLGNKKYSTNKSSQEKKMTDVVELDFALQEFIQYLFCAGVEQGCEENMVNFWNTWADMLNMQLYMYGKVKDKYPENLFSDELKIAARVAKLQRLRDSEEFSASVVPWKQYEYKGAEYHIVTPKTPADMIAEGQMQSNCVASYIDNVVRGDCMIFFMRSNGTPDKSLVTIEIRNDFSLGQVKAKFNARPTEEEMAFVTKWYHQMFQ